MKVTFFGAAQEVTGSMHLLEADEMLVALDCGLFQGKRQEAQAKNERFPCDPAKLHAVVLSHAHVDHCGRLPLLVKRGFAGPIYSTPATRDLAALLMEDSAHIQLEDAHFLNKKRAKDGEAPVQPLYDASDAATALGQFRTIAQEQVFWVTKRLKATFHEAGHMLGASTVELRFQRPGRGGEVSLLFTGDLGRVGEPILRSPRPLPPCAYVISESTYGGRVHPPTADLKERLAEVVTDTVARGGKVIIPAFSIGRTQGIVYVLHQLLVEGKISPIPIFIDSPLAVNATEVFRLHPDLFDAEARRFQGQTGDILGAECCTYVHEVEESKRLNTRHGSFVIISASGMCETGRIVHHLANNVESPKNTILIVGFQAAHTLGRRIVEKQPHLNIFGKKLKLRARVVALNGFSAHADREELRGLLSPIAATCRRLFLVHGEPDQMSALEGTLRGEGFEDVRMPSCGENFDLDGGTP